MGSCVDTDIDPKIDSQLQMRGGGNRKNITKPNGGSGTQPKSDVALPNTNLISS